MFLSRGEEKGLIQARRKQIKSEGAKFLISK